MNSPLSLILIATFLWGLWGFFAKLAVGRLGSGAVLLNAVSFFITIFLFLFFTNSIPSIKKDPIGIPFALFAGVCSGLASSLFYLAITKSPVGIMVAITALYPIVTIILSVLFLKESLTITKLMGIILGAFALILLAI